MSTAPAVLEQDLAPPCPPVLPPLPSPLPSIPLPHNPQEGSPTSRGFGQFLATHRALLPPCEPQQVMPLPAQPAIDDDQGWTSKMVGLMSRPGNLRETVEMTVYQQVDGSNVGGRNSATQMLSLLLEMGEHPNIAGLVGAYQELGQPVLVMEYMADSESLEDFIGRHNGRAVGLPLAMSIATQLIDAVAHMHKSGIAHGYLTADAIKLSKDGKRLLLGGLDFAQREGRGEFVGRAADVDACGRILQDLFRCQQRTKNRHPLLPLPSFIPAPLRLLLTSMLHLDPALRPTATQVASQLQAITTSRVLEVELAMEGLFGLDYVDDPLADDPSTIFRLDCTNSPQQSSCGSPIRRFAEVFGGPRLSYQEWAAQRVTERETRGLRNWVGQFMSGIIRTRPPTIASSSQSGGATAGRGGR
ncbi:unnamed protein product [Vitrella brassicaformis CCMP3155]|uniref:non-specific serine/threonine protein kinase n=1 Tax=Vitrella brassicaformis (strain CCMP3155) TaxID=1169540 RepID=A0A0G4EQA2_VITBC|nr:unnamed protein product [Vitrella brassicaformis CCMP3155]|eukprot:CEL99599.1 unnamed protein product [Vitrella brassicaformis CCMP3155]